MKKRVILPIILALTLIVVGCATGQAPETALEEQSIEVDLSWKNAPLTDIATEKTFTIRQFADRKVLVESFGMWNSVGLAQESEIKKLLEEKGEEVVVVSLNTDPHEDAAAIREHLAEYGFNWYFADASEEVALSLIKEFGVPVVNAMSAPIVLVCEDQSARLLPSSVKIARQLLEEIRRGCDVKEEPEEVIDDLPAAVERNDKEAAEPEAATGPAVMHGKTLEQRLEEAYKILSMHDIIGYDQGEKLIASSKEFLDFYFPDIELAYTDPGELYMPKETVPIRYYYSQEADKTFGLDNLGVIIFICDGKLEHVITDKDLNSNKCIVVPIYQMALENPERASAGPSPDGYIIGGTGKEMEGEFSWLQQWLKKFIGRE